MFKGKKKVKSKEDDNQKTFNTLAEKVIIIFPPVDTSWLKSMRSRLQALRKSLVLTRILGRGPDIRLPKFNVFRQIYNLFKQCRGIYYVYYYFSD